MIRTLMKQVQLAPASGNIGAREGRQSKSAWKLPDVKPLTSISELSNAVPVTLPHSNLYNDTFHHEYDNVSMLNV